MADITIYHNPQCSTSRNTLALIRNSGAEPEVIEYLQTPPSRETLVQLAAQTGQPLRALIRIKEKRYAELQLDNPALSDEQLLDAMLAHGASLNRKPPDISRREKIPRLKTIK